MFENKYQVTITQDRTNKIDINSLEKNITCLCYITNIIC